MGIFGVTSGQSRPTDYPPEGHEGLKGGKLRAPVDKVATEELTTFLEAEQQAKARGLTLKEMAVAKGNEGHEVREEDEMEVDAGNLPTGSPSPDADRETIAPVGNTEEAANFDGPTSGKRLLQRSAS